MLFLKELAGRVSISIHGLSAIPPLKKFATATFTALQVLPWSVDFDHTMLVAPEDNASIPAAEATLLRSKPTFGSPSPLAPESHPTPLRFHVVPPSGEK